MRNRNTSILVRIISILFLSATIILVIVSLINFSRQRNNYPIGMSIAGVPVGGLTPQEASERVLLVYTTPIEAQYGESIIHIDPAVVGFELDTEAMIAAADLFRTGGSFWGGFWNYLWNQEPTPIAIPLRATISEETLRNYLQNEIASRYDIPPEPAKPIPGSATFAPGSSGQILDIDRAVILIEDALRSPSNRSVSLTFQRSAPARPTIENLETLLQQTVNLAGFDGVTLDTHARGYALDESDDLGWGADATLNLPLIADRLAFRGTIGYVEEAGFVDYDFLVREAGVSNPEPDFTDPADVAANLRSEEDVDKVQARVHTHALPGNIPCIGRDDGLV